MFEAFCGGLDSLNAGNEITFTQLRIYICMYTCIYVYSSTMFEAFCGGLDSPNAGNEITFI